MKSVNAYKLQITTGTYDTASPEQKAVIQHLFGENTDHKYELYFHWYNLIHELGHGIIEFNGLSHPHPADEEQLVNDFAVAYWECYGETEKFNDLQSIVQEIIGNFSVPDQLNKGHIAYAKSVWGTEELMNFNNYGWFQFSCVQNSFLKHRNLQQVLADMTGLSITPPVKSIHTYNIDKEMPIKVVDDAKGIFKSLGIVMPDTITVCMADDPNCHMCQCLEA